MADPRPVPLVDLAAQHARVRGEIEAAMARVVETTRFIGGEECAALEAEFAAYCGVGHACGVANGTDALTLALRASGVGPGDEVVTVANTFIATGEAILLCGARPVFVDVDPDTFTMDPARLESALSARTRVILPVHVYGQPADMAPIMDLAARRGLRVLEDAAQAHGATLGGRRAGALAHAACFSFYPSKNLGAYGDAGMVTSDDAEFIGRVRRLANHGAGAHRYDNLVAGTNSRLDALQAAVLRVKLRHLEEWNAERRRRVEAYTSALEGAAGIVLPRERAGTRSAWHLYTLRARGRDRLRAHLQARGIATAVHYPRPIHLQPAMAAAGGRPGDLPVSERLCEEVVSLPLYPELPLDAVARIADEVRRA
ncbi:MAG TPA: DegT/DnrJ/EryC1/StrS family aminotransferase [Vicinamibacteria bacterium]|nr:DegT/DnrJ/EryC1/StrS family aminotransferase [Vicinamibacteria bacterium]